ncbi:MAG TPA: adenylate/guanylate cyclase domain-containing protein [Nevskia sp.]|nr:adenylate/guanylate cyclase domain-containing protein [Nevskia sp.]
MLQLIPHLMVALVALGMALAFIWADYRSPTSRLLSLTLVALAAAIALNTAYFYELFGDGDMPGWLALPEAIALVALLEWVLRVRRTLPAGELDVRVGDFMLRLGQAAGLTYALLSLLHPDLRQHDFLFAATGADALRRRGFWLFALPILFASGTGLFSGALILNRRPDRGERVRIVALGLSVPFFLAGFVLPPGWAPLSVLLGELVFLVGSVQYHVLQGQRGQFMSRFLSAQVASLVRERGLSGAMKQNYLEITAVVSDVRGFTAYAQAHPSSRVIQVLRDYYDAVGEVVGAYGGTIKDYAGDGILILVGAPIAMPNHAAVGLAIARGVRDAARRVTEKWSSAEHRLGIGIGVASGFVTVGVIGSASRLEYTAVGPAVNLASRLCEQALDGEILVDGRTRELAAEVPLEARGPIAVKGFDEAVALYALPAAA